MRDLRKIACYSFSNVFESEALTLSGEILKINTVTFTFISNIRKRNVVSNVVRVRVKMKM